MILMNRLQMSLALAAATFAAAACGPSTTVTRNLTASVPSGVREAAPPEPQLYEWYDDGGPGSVKVRIDLSSQMASFTRGGRDIGWSYVATGTSSHPTPTGTFSITEKVVDKYSNAYGHIEDEYGNIVNSDATPSTKKGPGERYVAAPMPYWMRLTSYGIGMHAGPIPNPGQPASHGCIRFPKRLAPTLYHAVKVGTPVTITH